MKTTTRRATVLAAVGALGLAGLAVAAPAIAGVGASAQPTAASEAVPGWQGGTGMGAGAGMGAGHGVGPAGGGMGVTDRDGSCGVSAAQGTLTTQQKTTLVEMAQEEKLAHDLYAAFAARYPALVFDRIAASEAQHLNAVRALLERYGLADPTEGQPAGHFSDAAVQSSYDKLLAQGRADQAAALQAGQTVEKADISDLEAALNGLTAADVQQLYTHLLTASRHHLVAFQNWSAR